MSLRDGLASLKREFSPKIPRTEYSTFYHHELVKTVTGMEYPSSDIDQLRKAQRKFLKEWDFGMMWAVSIAKGDLFASGALVTDMGHAVFGGDDYNDKIVTPYTDVEAVYALDPAKQFKIHDRAEIIAHYKRDYDNSCDMNGTDLLNMTGVYITMFSGLIDLLGWDAMLMAMGDDPERFDRLVASYVEWIQQYFEALAQSDIPVVMIHDDLCWTSGPVTRPEWYRANIFPHIKRFVTMLKEAGKLVYFTSDGLIETFYGDFVDLGIDSLVMEPCNDIFMFMEKYGDRCGAVGGMDCRDLTYAPLEVIKAKMEKVMALGRRYPGFMLAVGNHLSVDVPLDRALYYNELYEKLAYR